MMIIGYIIASIGYALLWQIDWKIPVGLGLVLVGMTIIWGTQG